MQTEILMALNGSARTIGKNVPELQEVDQSSFETEVLQYERPIMVDFWAPWCEPCKVMMPILEDIAAGTSLRIVKVNVEENADLAAKYRVSSIPMMVLFNQGSQAKKIVGVQTKEDVLSKIAGLY